MVVFPGIAESQVNYSFFCYFVVGVVVVKLIQNPLKDMRGLVPWSAENQTQV